MNYDLIKIKEKYGETMMKLCRRLFPTILEKEGVLFNLLSSKFAYSKFIGEDIINNKMEEKFKNYIYGFFDIHEEKVELTKTPKEILENVGYDLYECKTDEDVNKFKNYYKPGEELCTFSESRIKYCHVFFAVKKNVNEIKREDFSNPTRQDEYGTSVISIQFTRGTTNTLSIKNRYNHRVANPDATFSNNLDNIAPGLTQSFQNEYNLNINQNKVKNFEMPKDYVLANDGKFYKFNYELNNIYYCPDNIIIDRFEVKKEYKEKEKYIVLDYFIIDLVKKEIKLYDDRLEDTFTKQINNIKKIDIKKNKEDKTKLITITNENNEKIHITIDKYNRIIKINDPTIKDTYYCYLYNNKYLKELSLENVNSIHHNFLFSNHILEKLNIPNAKIIGEFFLYKNENLKELNINNVKKVGVRFLYNNEILESINIDNLLEVESEFLYNNLKLRELHAKNLLKVQSNFLGKNEILEIIDIPNIMYIENCFLESNKNIKEIIIDNVEVIGDRFLHDNEILETFIAKNLKHIKNKFLNSNNKLESIELPNVTTIENDFLRNNKILKIIKVPNLKYIGTHFLYSNNTLKELILNNTIYIGSHFMYLNNSLIIFDAELLESIGDKFLYTNETLKLINTPNIKKYGKSLCKNNEEIKLKILIPILEE